ncbi:cell envelope integrity protein TolA [Massilia jejuensis]|uniref:Cell envelope integrity protein TolA n=1 Tax=Massilia jejuensis TaxID=648894 RepID=A0ABW0PCW3_9BURK
MSAMKPALNGQYTLPPEPNRVPAILLALAVHALLLAFLWVGISWQNTEPPVVEAEVWDMKVESAAAPALPPPPPPPPQEVRAPEPAPVEPPPPPPKAAEPEPVKPAAPDINLEREKKLAEQKIERELEKKRALAENKEREALKAKELADKKALEKKLAEKKELEKKELEKKELEKKELDKKELEKKAADKKLLAEAEKKKVAADKAAKAKAEAAEQAKLDKLRDEELKRITGAAGSAGSAQKSSAPKIDAGYVAKLTALIKSNTTFAGSTDVPGNPKVVFKVELLPTGEILSVRMTRSSGVPQFDDAVERGINKSSPLPKKKDGTVERTIVVNFSMKDLD